MVNIPPNAPAPRLCRIAKRPDFDGFGFNLHAGKSRIGQFIGKVDKDSPAEAAGLLSGDRIIEVNGVNIGNENHKQVVQRIKLVPDVTELLVVDEEADEFYTARGIVVKSSQANVVRSHPLPSNNNNNNSRSLSPASSSDSETEDEVPAIRPTSPHAYTNGRASSSSSASSEDLNSAPAPRLCHVVKWNESDGFGFHLLADKNRQGQYIGKVDAGSAAEGAGLKQGDRIIEINGDNVTNQTHKDVVARIKAVPNETKMLVIDPAGEKYYKERNLTIRADQSNVRHIKTPAKSSRPNTLTLDVSKPHSPLKGISSAPAPRLCHIVKWKADEGYGFHLMADKKRAGHFIGKVDAGTPAAATGLRVGDRIVEVNGVNVDTEPHKQLVMRIKSVPTETKLLVLDSEADAYYTERRITVHGQQSNVQYVRTPPAQAPARRHSSSDASSDDEDRRSTEQVQMRRPKSQTSHSSSQSTATSTSPSSPTTRISMGRPLSMATQSAAAQSGLDLNMSAAELRARLASRKKYDPRRNTMELRRKHEIIQTM